MMKPSVVVVATLLLLLIAPSTSAASVSRSLRGDNKDDAIEDDVIPGLALGEAHAHRFLDMPHQKLISNEHLNGNLHRRDEGMIFRLLQTECSTFLKAKDCKDGNCDWLGAGTCVDPASGPTSPPPTGCSSFQKKSECPAYCFWDAGSCQDITTSPPSTTSPPTPPPTSPPSPGPPLPTMDPSTVPSSNPTTMEPSGFSSDVPSSVPSAQPSDVSTLESSSLPSMDPSAVSSSNPTTMDSSESPSDAPSSVPSTQPSDVSTLEPSSLPSMDPSTVPSSTPTPPPIPPPTLPPAPPPTSPPTSPSTSPPSTMVPYDLAKFHAVLDSSKLQYPESTPRACDAGEFAGFSCNGFNLMDDAYIHFQINSAEGLRSELRHLPEWPASSATQRSITARMMILQPDPLLVQQFTFLQVHTKDFLGNQDGPLLRVLWLPSRDGNNDWLWACIRTSLDPKANTFFPLQPRPEGFFDIEVRVVNSSLSILIDGSYPNQVFNNYDLTYWDSIQSNYFKAGAYLNSGSAGPVNVLFDQLNFAT